MGIASGETLSKALARLSCHEGIATGTTSDAAAIATIAGAARAPKRPTLTAVMYRHMTNAGARRRAPRQ